MKLIKAISFILVIACLFITTINSLPRPGKFIGKLKRARNIEHLNRITEASPIEEQWFYRQKVDHFNALDSRVFKQRYYVNSTFWKGKGSPVFVMLGGEGPISPTDVEQHFAITEQAAMFGALVISLEHRFYGKTQPFPDTRTENLRYLSSQQALADIATFHDYYSELIDSKNSKWVIFGGSYSGALAAWFRLKYPHIAVGAIASSGPVHAVVDFTKYLVTVGDSIGPACANVVKEAMEKVESMLTTETGRFQLEGMFFTCHPIESHKDAVTFLETLTDQIAGIVQYSDDNNDYEPMNITTMCKMLQSPGLPPINALVEFMNYTNIFYGNNCTEASYYKTVEELQETGLEDTAARSWTWQTCSEFGYFQTASAPNQPFSSQITLSYYLDMCVDVFGIDIKPNAHWINEYYGATNIQGTEIVLPNGSVDPWHNLGVLHAPNESEKPLFMTGTAHCADLYPPRAQDLPTLTNTRNTEIAYIKRWLDK